MGWACGAYGCGEGFIGSWWGNQREGDHWRDLGVDEWIIWGWSTSRGDVERIGLAQDRDRCRTLVSAVINLRVPWNAGNFMTSCKPVSCSVRTLHHGVIEYIYIYICQIFKCVIMPISEAARSKAWDCGRSLAEIVGSNPSRDMVVCCECCVLSGRCHCDSSSRGVLTTGASLCVI
jgi:hypothetical protein